MRKIQILQLCLGKCLPLKYNITSLFFAYVFQKDELFAWMDVVPKMSNPGQRD